MSENEMNEMSDMLPVVVEVDTVTGRIEVQSAGWGEDDPRWVFMSDASGCLVTGTTLTPWGEEETGLDRATEAVRMLGYTVGPWRDEDDVPAQLSTSQRFYAVITGRVPQSGETS